MKIIGLSRSIVCMCVTIFRSLDHEIDIYISDRKFIIFFFIIYNRANENLCALNISIPHENQFLLLKTQMCFWFNRLLILFEDLFFFLHFFNIFFLIFEHRKIIRRRNGIGLNNVPLSNFK